MIKYLRSYHNVVNRWKMCINVPKVKTAYLKAFFVGMCMKMGFLHEKIIVIHKLSTFCG